MKKLLILITCMLPFTSHPLFGSHPADPTCAPVRNGKICYYADEARENQSKNQLFETINQWAVKKYGSDVFYSNVSSNKTKGSVLVSSKIELLLDDTDKTLVKFRMRIQCYNNRYTAEITDITYQYNPDDDKRIRTYPAEDVIIREGKENKVAIIKDPLLFCNATRFLAAGILQEINDITQKK